MTGLAGSFGRWDWTGQGTDVFAYFNNDGAAHAVRNAAHSRPWRVDRARAVASWNCRRAVRPSSGVRPCGGCALWRGRVHCPGAIGRVDGIE